MKSFEIKQKTKVKVKIYGQDFELAKPTVSQIESLQEYSGMEGTSQAEIFAKICGFLDILGLPKDFSKDMEIDHLMELINFLSGELNFSKKNSEDGQS